MVTNNYFHSAAGYYFFFDDSSEPSVRRAWALATMGGHDVSVYRPFRLVGPWTGVPVIGLTSPALLRERLASLPIGSERALVLQHQILEAYGELSLAWTSNTNRIAA